MDGIANKKARNLFATSAVVLGSWFLGLKIPSAVLTSLQLPSDVVAWKIWALVSAVLGFQLWRLMTDLGDLVNAAGEDARALLLRRKAYLLELAFRRQTAGKRCWGIHLDLPDHALSVEAPQDVNVFEHVDGIHTSLTPVLTKGVVTFNWLGVTNQGQGRATANVPYTFSKTRRDLVAIGSFFRGVSSSAAFQDVALPLTLGFSALGISVIRTILLLSSA